MNNVTCSKIKSFTEMEPGEFGTITSGNCWPGLIVMKTTGGIVCLCNGSHVLPEHYAYSLIHVRIENKLTITRKE